jgi:hypothetical protein
LNWSFDTKAATPKTILFTVNKGADKRSVKLECQTSALYLEILGKLSAKIGVVPEAIKKIRWAGNNVVLEDDTDALQLMDGETIDIEVLEDAKYKTDATSKVSFVVETKPTTTTNESSDDDFDVVESENTTTQSTDTKEKPAKK